jgi:hypothetical protein
MEMTPFHHQLHQNCNIYLRMCMLDVYGALYCIRWRVGAQVDSAVKALRTSLNPPPNHLYRIELRMRYMQQTDLDV